MQSAIESFRSFNANSDTLRNILNTVPNVTVANSPINSSKNLISNGEFESIDQQFASDYLQFHFSPGARLAGNLGLECLIDSSTISNFNWRGEGFGGNGKFLAVDGATSPGLFFWKQKIEVKPNQSYEFGFQISSIGLSNETNLKTTYWERALVQVKINNVVKGYVLAPEKQFEYIPFQCDWFSGLDSVAEITLVDMNTGGRYNDFGIDHLNFNLSDHDFSSKARNAILVNGGNNHPQGSEMESREIASVLLREEFAFRLVTADFQLDIFPLKDYLKRDKSILGNYYTPPFSKYYERYFVVNGDLYSNYFNLDDSTLCKCCILNYKPYLLGKLSGQLLLLGFSFFISITALFFIRRLLKKQEEVTRLKYDITSNITHELKTPVATILAATEALQNYGVLNDKEKTQRYLAITNSQANKLNQLIEKALSFSAVEEDGFSLSLSKVDINNLVQELANSSPYVELENLSLELFRSEKEANVEIDVFHVSNILQTILDNSIKYGSAPVTIRISVTDLAGEIIVSIKDNGPGIPTQYQKLVFEKYFRIPTNDRYAVKGHGLGLNYVQTIMHLHKGGVKIISDGKKGTEILLKFKKLK